MGREGGKRERDSMHPRLRVPQQEIVSFRILLFGHPFLNLICNFDAIVDNKSRGGNEIFFSLDRLKITMFVVLRIVTRYWTLFNVEAT